MPVFSLTSVHANEPLAVAGVRPFNPTVSSLFYPEVRTRTFSGAESFAIAIDAPFVTIFWFPSGRVKEWYDSHAVWLWSLIKFSLPWLANLVLWIGVLALVHEYWGRAALAGTGALLLGLTARYALGPALQLRPPNSITFSHGYYTWLSSMGLLILASFVLAALRCTWQEPTEVDAEYSEPENVAEPIAVP
jgi:hypothetical protein